MFTRRFVAEAADIDQLGHVNNAVWVRWMEAAATAHWQAAADPAHQAAYLWVVTRHEIDYLRPLRQGEEVTASTWVAGQPTGARFDRLFAFTGTDGRDHVRARTTWAMVDARSLRPLRVPMAVARPFLGDAA